MLFSAGTVEIKCPIKHQFSQSGGLWTPEFSLSLSLCSSPSPDKALPAPAEALSDPSPSFPSG